MITPSNDGKAAECLGEGGNENLSRPFFPKTHRFQNNSLSYRVRFKQVMGVLKDVGV